MLDIWRAFTTEQVAAILRFHRDSTGESIDPERTKILECAAQPYPGYVFVKFVFDAQRIEVWSAQRQARFDVPPHAFSFALLKFGSDGTVLEIVPYMRDAAWISAVNSHLELELTPKTVCDYIVVYSLVIKAPSGSFHFLRSIRELNSAFAALGGDSIARVEGALRAGFAIREDSGELEIPVKVHSYPVLGTAFSFRMPVIYHGRYFVADMRISASGMAEMDEEQATFIDGLDALSPPEYYYALDVPDGIGRSIRASQRRQTRTLALFNISMLLERALSIFLTPMYLMTIYWVVLFGFSDRRVFDFFEALATSTTTSIVNLAIGAILILVVFARYAIIQIATAVRKLVPNSLTQGIHQAEGNVRQAVKRMGFIPFIVVTALEFMLAAFLALNVFIYGLINTFAFMGLPKTNFVEVSLLIVLSVPLLGPSLGWVWNITDHVGLYEIWRPEVLLYGASAYITTITVGLVLHIIKLARA